MIRDLWYRHIAKTFSWRVIASLTTLILAILVTGSVAVAGIIASTGFFIKMALYWFHELLWSQSIFGRVLVQKPGCVVWFTGLSGSGKTTVADRVAELLGKKLVPVKRIDGDVARKTFSSDLGFSKEDRAENCRRAAHVGSYLKESHVVLASFISPTWDIRQYNKYMCDPDYYLVYVDATIDECEQRDPKGMYGQIKDGKFKGQPFTGIHEDAPYDEPDDADLVLETEAETVDESANKVIEMLMRDGYV